MGGRPSQALRSYQLPLMMQHVRTYADMVVKVPVMAESISEGTLKQFSKQIGDRVELDEELATIETDKVCRRHRLRLLYMRLLHLQMVAIKDQANMPD